MKKLFALILLLSTCFSLKVNASHLMGGQITASRIDTFKYAIDLTLYRDTDGIPIATIDVLNYYEDSMGTWNYDTVKNIYADAGAYFINGTEVYHYYDTITFKHYGKFMISWLNCCRNLAILNMTSPASENLYLNTVVTVDSLAPNSTPIFLNPPVTLAQKNMYWNYNPLPYDADGDSIAWQLATPLSLGTLYPVMGYTIPRSNPLQAFTLDTITGQISWMPDTIGHFVASFLVSEFRNGLKIGEIRRDMQIIVVEDSTNNNGLKFATGSWNLNAQGYFEIPVLVNTPNTLTVIATDNDNDYCNLSGSGETFILKPNPSTLSVTPGNGVVNATYSWTPSMANLRNNNYLTVFRGDELHGMNHYITDLTVGFKVVSELNGTNELNQSIIKIYPNPATDKLIVQYSQQYPTKGQLQVLNSLGQVMVQTDLVNSVGMHNTMIQTSAWPQGVYFVQVQQGGQTKTQRFVKQ
ncbi:MAG: hypothetical protein RL138_1491 [Bacteroidota bacterium]|jgi:hypothetical protein